MARKDAGGRHCDVRDEYRRKIGKQDYLKSKSHWKKTKQEAELKRSGHQYKEMMLVIGTVAAVVAAIYALFYSMSK
ncbi:triple QxxK/R motif-containing protein-like [Watersipora subatra]|uniref:triple QxxK/R motif-containing protein-like n=1 Tax=Watersipora subatra TaxID=2589382 RepID=UPI00355B6D1F